MIWLAGFVVAVASLAGLGVPKDKVKPLPPNSTWCTGLIVKEWRWWWVKP